MKIRLFLTLLLALGVSNSVFASSSSNTDQLIALTKAGRHAECVRHAHKLPELERVHPDNLYVASICALRDNRPFTARSLLETLKAKEPKYAGAALARAQADLLAEDPAALAISLDALKKSAEQRKLEANETDWLTSISEREHQSRNAIGVQIGSGRSSNANAGSNESDFLGTPLNREVKRTPSSYVEIAADFRSEKSTGIFTGVGTALQVSRRSNFDAPFANQTIVAASVRYTHPKGHGLVSYAIAGFNETVNSIPQRRYITAEIVAAQRFSDRWELSATGRAGRMNFRISSRPDLDVWRLFWGANATRILNGKTESRVGVGVFGGGDEEVVRHSNFGNSRLGIRMFADIRIGTRTRLSVETATSIASFDGHQGFGGVTRLDKQNSVAMTAVWKPKPTSKWDVLLKGAVRQLDSNVSIFSFDQTELGVHVRFRR